jgi:DNA repair exonuclease SbcCD nuclease subunit
MNIIHFSDTHLGFSDLDIINKDGINQREADFYDAFSQVIDEIIQNKPNYIIHTGDLFHRSNPSNRAITFCLEQLKRLEKYDIPFILIAGNHSTPKTIKNSPILKALKTINNIYAVFNQEYEKIEFKDIIFHAIPHINDEKLINKHIEFCEKNIDKSKKNVLMLHCSVGASYLMQEFGEWVYPKDKEYLFEQMDYVALGHWHGFGSINKKFPHVCYSGSLERTSSNDKRNDKGYVNIDLEESCNIVFNEINLRKTFIFEIDCIDFEDNLHKIIEDSKKLELKGSLLEIKLTNLSATQSIDIPNNYFNPHFEEVLHLSIKREFLQKEQKMIEEDIKSISLQDYFVEQLGQNIKDKKELDRLQKKIDILFGEYEEVYDDSL